MIKGIDPTLTGRIVLLGSLVLHMGVVFKAYEAMCKSDRNPQLT
jgi:hypothetical protein